MLIFDQKSSGNPKIAQKMDSPRRFSKSTVIPLQTERSFRKFNVIPFISVEFHSEPFKDFHVPTGALRKSHNSLYYAPFLPVAAPWNSRISQICESRNS